MAQQDRLIITSPVGRIVAGSLYKPNEKDFDGKQLTVKTGPNAGKPRVNFFFALAIPKNAGETHWAYTTWGKQIWELGNRAFPQAAQRLDFAWKIEDGDSQIPNKRNRKPCDNEGWPGCWILKFSGGFAPKIYRQEAGGYVQEMTEDFVKPGYFVEVCFNVEDNAQPGNPGVYLNHSMVCFRGYGTEISFGPDVNEAGFGQAPLPAGASLQPLPGTAPLPAAAPAPTTVAYIPPMAAAAPPPVPVSPNPQFMQLPAPGASPGPQPPQSGQPAQTAAYPYPPQTASTALPAALPAMISPSNPPPPPPVAAAPAVPQYQMTAKANGVTREAFLAGGWTDAQLIANGYMSL